MVTTLSCDYQFFDFLREVSLHLPAFPFRCLSYIVRSILAAN